MPGETVAVHVTHETVAKVGGIGAVLQGFFTSKAYLDAVDRSILIGPLFTTEGSVHDRLGENSEVLYSSIDGMMNPGYGQAFDKIESHFNVGIVYGRRTFTDDKKGIKSSQEVLLIDIRHIDKGVMNEFKKRLFDEFGVRSHLHEHLWEFEQYLRLAPPAIAALKAIISADAQTTIISHEFMGMPTALAAILDSQCNYKTIFYAHEVATMRRIVEEHPGHDTMFYNVMRQAYKERLYVNEVFGDQSCYFKHVLVEAAKYCDHIFAVGDYVADELKFLAPEFESTDTNIVYNGIPAYETTLEEKNYSKEMLRQYCQTLLGYCPDFIFTHVTRLVCSKGLWRDLRVLYEIEKYFRVQGKTGVYYLLSTEVSKRRTHDIHHIESAYNWPVAHREGWPDLSGGEANFYTAIQEFNARSRNIKAVFINQFGFDNKSCGNQMPEEMKFMDIRRGTDVEFGQSIYEPFGIAQLEPLTFGGICVFTNVCGCAGFLRDVTAGRDISNVIIADYTNLGPYYSTDIEDLIQIDRNIRDQIEIQQSIPIAKEIIARLPRNDSETAQVIELGYQLAQNMSWEKVVSNYLVDILRKDQQQITVSS